MTTTQLVIEYLPLCVEISGFGSRLRVAMQMSVAKCTFIPYSEVGLADGHALARVWEKFGSVPGFVALLCVSESEGQIVHTYVHVMPSTRKNGSILSMPKFDGLIWCSPDNLPIATRLCVEGFLQRELRAECRLSCRFLPNEWTASELRRVRTAITGIEQDASNARVAVERMVRQRLVESTGRMVATLTRPAPTYIALGPSEFELHGSPWRRMSVKLPRATP